MYPFIINEDYRKKDIYRIIGLPEDTHGGNWDTGYNEHNSDFFIFCNVGTPGRTGHDYGNRFDGEDLFWYAKNNTRLNQPQIQRLLNPKGKVYIFYRTDSSRPYTYAGFGAARHHQDTSPVQITWEITSNINDTAKSRDIKYHAGALKQVYVNVYERNPVARKLCIEKHGTACAICGFDFEETYGNMGKNYIHVHYIPPLYEIAEEHEIDPENDLIPICPNCHAMIHTKRPAIDWKKLKESVTG